MRRDLVPSHHHDVLSRCRHALEPNDVFIQVLMVNPIDELLCDDAFQVHEVHCHPGSWINRHLERHFKHVVVAVAFEVVAFAEDSQVLGIAQVRAMQAMSAGKSRTTGDVNLGHGNLSKIAMHFERRPGDGAGTGFVAEIQNGLGDLIGSGSGLQMRGGLPQHLGIHGAGSHAVDPDI